jgi:hypothetical protein
MRRVLSYDEMTLLACGITLFQFVSFAEGTKPKLSAQDRDALEAIWLRLARIIKREGHAPRPEIEVELSQSDVNLLALVIKSDMGHCRTDDSDYSTVSYRVHFRAERKRVEALLARLLALGTCDD